MDRKDREILYFVVFDSIESTKELVLINSPGAESQFIDIGYCPLRLQADAIIVLTGFTIDCHNAGMKRKGIKTPWKRAKRCYLCDVPKSKSVD